MSPRFDGKIAVVTGVSSGIGRRVALDLAERGATVVGLARRQDLLAEVEGLLRSSSPNSVTRVCDVGDTGTYERVLAEIEEKIFGLDREGVGNDLLDASADRKAYLDLALIARELQIAGRTEHVDMLFSFAVG